MRHNSGSLTFVGHTELQFHEKKHYLAELTWEMFVLISVHFLCSVMFCVVSVFSGIYLVNSLSACQLTGLWHQMNSGSRSGLWETGVFGLSRDGHTSGPYCRFSLEVRKYYFQGQSPEDRALLKGHGVLMRNVRGMWAKHPSLRCQFLLYFNNKKPCLNNLHSNESYVYENENVIVQTTK